MHSLKSLTEVEVALLNGQDLFSFHFVRHAKCGI